MIERGRGPHPCPLELIQLVRGVLDGDRARLVLGHCVSCRQCLGIVRALGLLRHARGLGVHHGLEPTRGRPTIH